MDGTTLPDESTRRRIESLLFTAFSAAGEARWTPCRGGLSEARVWRVERSDAVVAVRSIPESHRGGHRAWIRHTLQAACAGGLKYVAVPCTSSEGGVPLLDEIGGYEASEWKPGEPVSTATDDRGVAAAVRGLARFHQALQRMPPSPRQSICSFQAAAGRLGEARRAVAMPIDGGVLTQWPELAGVVRRLPAAISRAGKLGAFLRPSPHSTQPVHGDARPEHFLVESDLLTGMIDFDAMRNDSPLADLARFAGELARGDCERLRGIVSHYEEAIGEPIDHRAVQALDLVAAAFSASNWIGWLSDSESRWRHDPELVRGRLASIYARLGA